jgi:hypothetical protein
MISILVFDMETPDSIEIVVLANTVLSSVDIFSLLVVTISDVISSESSGGISTSSTSSQTASNTSTSHKDLTSNEISTSSMISSESSVSSSRDISTSSQTTSDILKKIEFQDANDSVIDVNI